MYVYKITCILNNKVYIGQTCEPINKRFKRHMGYQKDTHDTKFYRAVRKYGVENFYIELLDTATTQEELDEKEIFWINKYDSVNKGYNTKSSKGKCGGDTLSNHHNLENIRKKISESKKGDKNPMKNNGLCGDRNGMYGRKGYLAPSSRKCVAIPVSDPDFIIIFDTLMELQSCFNVTTLGMVSSRCSQKTKAPYKGYYFRYYDDI